MSAPETAVSRRLVLACQGVDAAQYRECIAEVLRVAAPADWIGLGGWCILGRYRHRWAPAFWETLRAGLPPIARAGVRRVHLFGVLWPPALGVLLCLADRHALAVSTDSGAPLLAATWPDPKRAGVRAATYRGNVAWWRKSLATLRGSPHYRAPPRPTRRAGAGAVIDRHTRAARSDEESDDERAGGGARGAAATEAHGPCGGDRRAQLAPRPWTHRRAAGAQRSSRMTTTTTKQAAPPSRGPAAGGGGRHGAPPRRPYSVREAAALLGVSEDAIERNYQDLEGFRIGRRILIPRRVVDRLTGAPGGEDDERGGGGEPVGDQAPPALERVLALLPLLARNERVAVAQASLSPAPPG